MNPVLIDSHFATRVTLLSPFFMSESHNLVAVLAIWNPYVNAYLQFFSHLLQ